MRQYLKTVRNSAYSKVSIGHAISTGVNDLG